MLHLHRLSVARSMEPDSCQTVLIAASQFCNVLFEGLLGNGLYKKMLAATGLPLALQWINTTAVVTYVSLDFLLNMPSSRP
jgi:hypothetical protein